MADDGLGYSRIESGMDRDALARTALNITGVVLERAVPRIRRGLARLPVRYPAA
jgi:hypothetical protein